MNLNEKLKLCLESLEIRSAIAFELIIEDVEKLQEQNKTMQEALEFYADRNNWLYFSEDGWRSRLKTEDCAMYNTGGGRARLALAKVKE